jgi:hypothetical protein
LPLQFTIDHDHRLVEVTAQGAVVLQDITDYLDAVAVQGAMPYDKLFDASAGQFALSDDDMMVLGARVSAYAAMEPRGPIAIIVASEETSHLARRFANLGGAKRPVKIFRHVTEARSWLSSLPKG